MSESTRIAVLVGSLRADSFSRKIAHALIDRAPSSMHARIVEIGDLPLYNEDLDQGAPPIAWANFRSAIQDVDAILFVTPEYNRSIPACLKNALDVGSRPPNKSVFDGMPVGVVSVTPYKLGAFGANHALRQTFVFLNMPAMQQPEVYIGNVKDILTDDGKVKDQDTSKLLDKFMTTFDSWIEHVRRRRGSNHDFDAFMQNRRDIARDYVNGDSASLEAAVTENDPATFFAPHGDVIQGATAIRSRYGSDAKFFKKGGTTKLEVLQSYASGDLAFWTGYQHAEVNTGKDGKKVPMTLRITEVFRFEDGSFKLVHCHADEKGK